MGTAHDPTAFEAALSGRLAWTQDDLYQWSLRMAERCIDARAFVPDEVFADIVPSGETEEAALARASDPKFWRRKGGLALKRAKSVHAQHAKAVGGETGSPYVGKPNSDWFRDSRKRQAEWAKACVVMDKGSRAESVPLSAVMNTPEKLWAKTYTFIKGLQEVATGDHGLQWFMATVTLPGSYHANPSKGCNTWSGASVKAGFDELMDGINRMGAGLAKAGIRKVGIGSEEPQKDETPHLHEGIFYAADADFWNYLEGYARQFPGPLKVVRGSKVKSAVVYATLDDVTEKKGAPASVDAPGRVTITVGEAGAAAFASYMAKYISKNSGKTLAVDDDEHASATAVLAHRNAQGIRGWRFYGLPEGALSGWDELRRVDDEVAAPTYPTLVELAELAKAGKAGDFIRKLGGINVAAKPARYLGLRLWTEERVNRYGEPSKRPKGVQLLEFTREKRKVPTGRMTKRGRPQMRTRVVVETRLLDSVVTRYREWEILSNAEAKGLAEFTEPENRAVGVPPNCPRGAPGEDAQARAIRAPLDESTVVLSSAGSGKTHVLTERAKFLVDHGVPAKDVLITTYTREAAQELEQRLRSKGVNGVRVGTMHSIGLDMLGGGTWHFDQMIAKSTELGAQRFHLLVDEAQDLNADQIAWAKAHAKTLFVVGDPNQAIYEFRGSVPEGMGELLRHVRGLKGVTPDMFDSATEVAMLENRRSTSTIVALGNAVVGGEAWSGREGAPVEVRSATSRADELATIVANAEGALVLVRTNRERIEVKAALARAGVTPQGVMTVHASKGKEADRVVLACGVLKDKTAGEAEERRLLYVAVTRARSALVVTSTGRLPVALADAVGQLVQA
jgi:hypothetical protein